MDTRRSTVRVRVQDLGTARAPSLLDDYEYVMHGKVYKLDAAVATAGAPRAAVYVSFGGLLMLLHADPQKLSLFQMDSMVYLLMRKAL
jgi:RNA polymerase Rpb8